MDTAKYSLTQADYDAAPSGDYPAGYTFVCDSDAATATGSVALASSALSLGAILYYLQ